MSSRTNLFIEVRPKKTDAHCLKEIALLARSGSSKSRCGIIYALSRDDTERLARGLCNEGIVSRPYHAGLSPNVRKDAFDAWMSGDCQVIVATVAFGMGIDKRDVRFVCHVAMTSSIERYHQEIGRAGRDGSPCRCIAWHSPADLKRLKNMTSKKSELQKVDEANRFFSCISRCRRSALLAHFGEQRNGNCEACDVCARERLGISLVMEQRNFAEQAAWLLELATSLEPFGLTAVKLRDVAKGKSLDPKGKTKVDSLRTSVFSTEVTPCRQY